MENNLPAWLEDRIAFILKSSEKIVFTVKGRVELAGTSVLNSLFFWIKYITLNYIASFFSMFYRDTAYLIVTDLRLIVVTKQHANFPFWVIPFSKSDETYVIPYTNLASVMGRNSSILWIIPARGYEIESTGSRTFVFNGVSKNLYSKGLKIFSDYILENIRK